MSNITKTVGKDGKTYYFKKSKNGRKKRIPDPNNKKYLKEGYVICSGDKNGSLQVHEIINGVKHRVPNSMAKYCDSTTLKDCGFICETKNPKTPCAERRTVFASKKEVRDYCKVLVDGEYSRFDRKRIVERANKELEKSMEEQRNKSLKRKVKFDYRAKNIK